MFLLRAEGRKRREKRRDGLGTGSRNEERRNRTEASAIAGRQVTEVERKQASSLLSFRHKEWTGAGNVGRRRRRWREEGEAGSVRLMRLNSSKVPRRTPTHPVPGGCDILLTTYCATLAHFLIFCSTFSVTLMKTMGIVNI